MRRRNALIPLLLGIAFYLLPGTALEAGTLVVVGGRQETQNEKVYKAMLDAVGGAEKARIAIIPAASATPTESGNLYISDFLLYGVTAEQCRLYPVAVVDDDGTDDIDESTWRDGAWDEALAEDARERNLFFFTGGDQARIMTCLVADDGTESPLLRNIRSALAASDDVVVAGTSAGAAIMSDPMLTGGDPILWIFKGPDYLASQDEGGLAQGLGFMEGAISDQHLLARGRLARLIVACLENEAGHDRGIGVDENTAFIVKGDDLSVVGETGAFIVDTSRARWKREGDYMGVVGVRVHYLDDGDGFDLATGEARPGPGKSLIEEPAYGERPLETDLFSAYTFLDMVTKGLVDSSADSCKGISFSVAIEEGRPQTGSGIRWTFRKGADTVGYKGTERSDFPLSPGGEHPHLDSYCPYTALNVIVDIVPFAVSVQ